MMTSLLPNSLMTPSCILIISGLKFSDDVILHTNYFPRQTDGVMLLTNCVKSAHCQNYWTPHGEISIDEQMIATRCGISFIQYMPKKPVKFGVKNWVLADSIMPHVLTFKFTPEKTKEHPRLGSPVESEWTLRNHI